MPVRANSRVVGTSVGRPQSSGERRACMRYAQQPWGLWLPALVVVACVVSTTYADMDLLVVDQGGDRVLKYSPTGQYLGVSPTGSVVMPRRTRRSTPGCRRRHADLKTATTTAPADRSPDDTASREARAATSSTSAATPKRSTPARSRRRPPTTRSCPPRIVRSSRGTGMRMEMEAI